MNEKELIEKRLSGEDVFCGKIIKVQLDTVELPNKRTATREVVRHNGAVCIIPLTDKNEVILERQYRYAQGKVILEIPAGKLDGDEDPLHAAERELREETGAIAGKMTYLGLYIGSPAILDEKIYMYLAEELSFGERQLDDDEFLTLERMPIEEIVDKILLGEVPDGKTQAAVLRAYLMKKKRTEK
ncbi:MAG: NUDIX hydrolase [Clostridia bacterium]|nr:NUDIX hydrolase [Clostridia bacterium]